MRQKIHFLDKNGLKTGSKIHFLLFFFPYKVIRLLPTVTLFATNSDNCHRWHLSPMAELCHRWQIEELEQNAYKGVTDGRKNWSLLAESVLANLQGDHFECINQILEYVNEYKCKMNIRKCV